MGLEIMNMNVLVTTKQELVIKEKLLILHLSLLWPCPHLDWSVDYDASFM